MRIPFDTFSNSDPLPDTPASPTTAGLSPETVRSILAFRDERHWAQFHEPKDLAIALSVEASELLDVFTWSGTDLRVENKADAQAEELADVLIYTVLLADRLGLDLNDAVARKMAKNVRRYPAEAFQGDGAAGEGVRAVAARLRAEDRARCAGELEVEPQDEDERETAPAPLISDPAPYRAVLLRLETEGPDAVGGWKADQANRMMFAVYAPETVALWRQVETDAKAANVASATPEARRTAPEDARAALAQLRAAVETERRADGAFLEAVKSGEVGHALAVIVRETESAGSSTHQATKEDLEANAHEYADIPPQQDAAEAARMEHHETAESAEHLRIGSGAPTLADDLALLATIERNPSIAGEEVASPTGTFFIYADDVNALRGRLAVFRLPNHWLALEAAGLTNPLEEAWGRLDELDAEALRGVLTELLAADREDSGYFARAAASGRVRKLLEALAGAFRRGW